MISSSEQSMVGIGRLNPIHLWHENIISSNQEWFKWRYLQVLGSSNAQFSLRNYFSYCERRGFFKNIFPEIPVVWIPDYASDKEWLTALDDLLMSHFWLKSTEEVKEKITFVWWCEEDVSFFIEDCRNVKIINRFDWTTPKISATEVRDALIQSRSLEWLVNPKIIDEVKTLFHKKWENFKKI